MTISDLIGYQFALLSFRKSRSLTRDAQVGGKKDLFIKFGPALVSIRNSTMFILSACGPTLKYVFSFVVMNSANFDC